MTALFRANRDFCKRFFEATNHVSAVSLNASVLWHDLKRKPFCYVNTSKLFKAALEGFARNYNTIQTLPSQFKRTIMTAQGALQIIFSNLSKQGMNIS